MHRSLFAFIWAHSLPQQLKILAVTVLSFPLLYATLELPKRIVNDAIEPEGPTVSLWGATLTQVEMLAVLCALFLAAVLAWGLVKMRINTMKGVLAERLLRRFRYDLIARALRFPLSRFRRTSQGELVSMVTAETEPLGGIMGDALAQPVFQAGQMATILGFLFVQSPWLGLAAMALVPLQAWLIPKLQRRINAMNKQRVQEVRRLSERIGDSVAGVEDLRANGGVPLALADFTDRLGRIFWIRYRIYRAKFFMKFLNNFITQLTPFFFYAIGGYLAIQGELTVGALVAAIAAYKDIAGPWKELLAYYTQAQDMTLRYDTIVEQFEPAGMIPAERFEGRPEEIPRLAGPIRLEEVTLREPDGTALLEDLSFEIPAGAMAAIRCPGASERRGLCRLLSRTVTRSSGRIEIAGQDIAGLHQGVLAARVGVAGAQPHLFNTTIGRNVRMPLMTRPRIEEPLPEAVAEALAEARRAGNSPDPLAAEWLDPALAGVADREELEDWWLSIVEALGTDDYLFERGLGARVDPEAHPRLAERVVALRPEIARRIEAAGLEGAIHRFDPERFNPGLAVGGNLLYAIPRRPLPASEMTVEPWFLSGLRRLGLEEDLARLSASLLSALIETFGEVGSAHPLYRRLEMGEDLFDRLSALEARRAAHGIAGLSETDRALLLTLPFRLTAEQIGEAFPEELKARILEERGRCGDLRRTASDAVSPIDPERYAEGLTVLENAIFGTVPLAAGAEAERVREIVGEALREDGLKRDVALLIWDEEAGLGGSQLPQAAHERIAVVRAVIKRPDVLVLDRVLASHDAAQRRRTRDALRRLLPEATLVFIEPEIARPEAYDTVLEIEDGRLASAAEPEPEEGEPTASGDLARKTRALAKVSLFEGLDRGQLRLLAFASNWWEAEAGQVLFRQGDPADAAYLLTDGRAELRWPETAGEATVTTVEPGRLIGDLSVITHGPRTLDMVAVAPSRGLRIGAQELNDVIESDAAVAASLLRTVSGYLVQVAGRLQDARQRLPNGAREESEID